MPQAYSYIRFSSDKQKIGDSLRRQLKSAEEYASRNGYSLDSQSYRDLGVSAYKGKNAVEGKLAAFLEAVDKGLIPRGSILLVESLDRISRAEIDEALSLLLSIIQRDITIVTLLDQQVYSKERLKQDRGVSLIVSISILIRAHDESRTKADRISKRWSQKRLEANKGQIMTAMAPSWLRLNKDKTEWIVDENKASIVKRIFELALAGNGTPTIARIFNDECVPTMRRATSWTFGVINAILKNPAVVGIYSPKSPEYNPISNYYPSIVSDAQFQLVRETLLRRMWVGGRSGERVANLFAGISFCEACGSRMRIKSTKRSANRTLCYVQCVSAYSGAGCKERVFPYYAAERAVLRHLADDLSEKLFEVNFEQEDDPRAVMEAERLDLKSRISSLIEQMETVRSPQLAERINTLQNKVDDLDERLAKLVDPRIRLNNALEVGAMFDKLKGFGEDPNIEERRKIQATLRHFLEQVIFASDRGDGRPAVALKYHSYLNWSVTFLDVKPFMEKVGGNRRPKDWL